MARFADEVPAQAQGEDAIDLSIKQLTRGNFENRLNSARAIADYCLRLPSNVEGREEAGDLVKIMYDSVFFKKEGQYIAVIENPKDAARMFYEIYRASANFPELRAGYAKWLEGISTGKETQEFWGYLSSVRKEFDRLSSQKGFWITNYDMVPVLGNRVESLGDKKGDEPVQEKKSEPKKDDEKKADAKQEAKADGKNKSGKKADEKKNDDLKKDEGKKHAQKNDEGKTALEQEKSKPKKEPLKADEKKSDDSKKDEKKKQAQKNDDNKTAVEQEKARQKKADKTQESKKEEGKQNAQVEEKKDEKPIAPQPDEEDEIEKVSMPALINAIKGAQDNAEDAAGSYERREKAAWELASHSSRSRSAKDVNIYRNAIVSGAVEVVDDKLYIRVMRVVASEEEPSKRGEAAKRKEEVDKQATVERVRLFFKFAYVSTLSCPDERIGLARDIDALARRFGDTPRGQYVKVAAQGLAVFALAEFAYYSEVAKGNSPACPQYVKPAGSKDEALKWIEKNRPVLPHAISMLGDGSALDSYPLARAELERSLVTLMKSSDAALAAGAADAYGRLKFSGKEQAEAAGGLADILANGGVDYRARVKVLKSLLKIGIDTLPKDRHDKVIELIKGDVILLTQALLAASGLEDRFGLYGSGPDAQIERRIYVGGELFANELVSELFLYADAKLAKKGAVRDAFVGAENEKLVMIDENNLKYAGSEHDYIQYVLEKIDFTLTSSKESFMPDSPEERLGRACKHYRKLLQNK